MATVTTTDVVLEPAAKEFAEATANPPFLFELPVVEGRKAVDEVQSGEIAKPEIDEQWVNVKGGPTGEVPVRIVKPRGATGTLPVIVYLHGAGWVFGDALTHDRLVRELAVGVQAAVVFPDTAVPRRPAIRSRSSRATRSRAGPRATVPATASMRAGLRSPAIRSAATCRLR